MKKHRNLPTYPNSENHISATPTARVLGVDEELIMRLYITLCGLSSNNKVDPKKLYKYEQEAAKIYISL